MVTFADSATLHFNDDDLEFTHLPNAHTDTDIMVRFRKANVVHMGDTFTGGFPFIDGSNGGTLDGFIRAHETVLADTSTTRRRSFAATVRSATRRSCRRTTTCWWWCATASPNS